MDDIHDLADDVYEALKLGIKTSADFATNKRLSADIRMKAISQICRLGQIILAKTLPDLKASHEIHSNTTDLAKILLPILGPEETQARLDAIELNLLPKTAAGRPKEVILDG